MSGDEEVTGLHVVHRHRLGNPRVPVDPDAAVHLGVEHQHPLASHAHERGEIRGGVEPVGKDTVPVRRLHLRVLRLHRNDAVFGDGLEQLVQVSRVAPEDAHHSVRRLILHAPDLEGEHLELTAQVHDVVHDLRHHE